VRRTRTQRVSNGRLCDLLVGFATPEHRIGYACMNIRGDKGPEAESRPSVATLLRRAFGLRCPACGQGTMFAGWFRMHPACSLCGRSFDRGPGYLLGSIYFNYGVTALLVVIAYFGLYFGAEMSGSQILWLLTAFSLAFPLWFFRYARSLWIAFDELWDPWQPEPNSDRLPTQPSHRTDASARDEPPSDQRAMQADD